MHGSDRADNDSLVVRPPGHARFGRGIADRHPLPAARHDLEADLRTVAAPTLILSDARDSLHANDRRAAALRPNFRYRQFSDGGAHAMMLDPARWAEVAAGFVGETR